jgi:hypothetical protein
MKDFLTSIGGSWENAIKKSMASYEVNFLPPPLPPLKIILFSEHCA